MIKVIDGYHYFIDEGSKAQMGEWGYCDSNGEISKISNGQHRHKVLATDNPRLEGKKIPIDQYRQLAQSLYKSTTGLEVSARGIKKINQLYYNRATIQDTLSALILLH